MLGAKLLKELNKYGNESASVGALEVGDTVGDVGTAVGEFVGDVGVTVGVVVGDVGEGVLGINIEYKSLLGDPSCKL